MKHFPKRSISFVNQGGEIYAHIPDKMRGFDHYRRVGEARIYYPRHIESRG
jgi:hypothetical protein